jgi:hypothetical protein
MDIDGESMEPKFLQATLDEYEEAEWRERE